MLKLLRFEDVGLITQKLSIGDGLTFKYCFETWKDQNNSPSDQRKISCSHIMGTPSTLSLSSDETEEPVVKAIDILKNHQNGRKIIEKYQKTKSLTEEHRTIIVATIVQYYDFNNISMTLQASYRLENEIIEIFPTEKLEFYRTDRRGKIYIKYHNMKK